MDVMVVQNGFTDNSRRVRLVGDDVDDNVDDRP